MKTFFLIVIFSINSLCFAFTDGEYEVKSTPCAILYINKDGATISQWHKIGSKINIQFSNDKILTTDLVDYYLLGLKRPNYSTNFHFNKKYQKNTTTKTIRLENKLQFIEETKSFKFFRQKGFCHPYDFTGLSCVVGMLNPFNWVPKRVSFPNVRVETEFVNLGDDVFSYTRTLSSEDGINKVHHCKLSKSQ